MLAPHDVAASADGRTAYISSYGAARGSPEHADRRRPRGLQAVLPPVDLGPIRGPHGMMAAGGTIYFTAEVNKVIGGYDPTAKKIDWVMGEADQCRRWASAGSSWSPMALGLTARRHKVSSSSI